MRYGRVRHHKFNTRRGQKRRSKRVCYLLLFSEIKKLNSDNHTFFWPKKNQKKNKRIQLPERICNGGGSKRKRSKQTPGHSTSLPWHYQYSQHRRIQCAWNWLWLIHSGVLLPRIVPGYINITFYTNSFKKKN
jgi:hypothetical protein